MSLRKFVKMHGAGNDYVYFDCVNFEEIPNPEEVSIRLSDRHKGIGSDGVILVCKSDVADAKMRMFNADGSEGIMCGNGIRCVAKFIYDFGIAKRDVVTIETLGGIKTLELDVKNGKVANVRVDMGKAEFTPSLIPVELEGERVVNYPHTYSCGTYNITCVSMGNPHCVIFEDGVEELDLEKIGPSFENDPIFPKRVNTEFVRVNSETDVTMRVWERGSGETWACGTGACAVVAACVANGFCKKDTEVCVHLRGGDLFITYTDNTVYMFGEAVTVFEGTVEL